MRTAAGRLCEGRTDIIRTLLAEFRMDHVWMLDEMAGPTARDTGQVGGIPGTISGATVTGLGPLVDKGASMGFSRAPTDSHINMGNVDLTGYTKLTMGAFCQRSVITILTLPVIIGTDGATNAFIAMDPNTFHPSIQIEVGGVNHVLDPGHGMVALRTMLLVVTWDGSTLTAYELDSTGTFTATAATTGSLNATGLPLYIGQDAFFGPNRGWDGHIGPCFLSNSQLSGSQIQRLFDAHTVPVN